ATFEELHGRERQAYVLGEFVDRQEAGMAQVGGGGNLAAEAIEQRAVGNVRQNLEGYRPAGVAVEGAEHIDGLAVANFGFHFILADTGSVRRLRRGRVSAASTGSGYRGN